MHFSRIHTARFNGHLYRRGLSEGVHGGCVSRRVRIQEAVYPGGGCVSRSLWVKGMCVCPGGVDPYRPRHRYITRPRGRHTPVQIQRQTPRIQRQAPPTPREQKESQTIVKYYLAPSFICGR